jgi:hypothetical protein
MEKTTTTIGDTKYNKNIPYYRQIKSLKILPSQIHRNTSTITDRTAKYNH